MAVAIAASVVLPGVTSLRPTAAPAEGAPPNDSQENATPIPRLPFEIRQDTRRATAGPEDPCCDMGATVWFRFSAAETTRLQISTEGSDYATRLVVLPQANSVKDGNVARVEVPAGGSIDILVGSWFEGGMLKLRVEKARFGPSNDAFDDAKRIPILPFRTASSLRHATLATDDPFGAVGPTVWYTFAPTTRTRVELSTLGSDFPAQLRLYLGERGALTEIGTTAPVARMEVAAGDVLRIMVSSASGVGGTLRLSARELTGGPANDAVSRAIPIPTLPFETTIDGTRATAATDDPIPAGPSAWFRFTATQATRLRATDGIYFAGPAHALRVVNGHTPTAPTEVLPGQTVHILVPVKPGQLVFQASAPDGPANDFFDAAPTVTIPATHLQDTFGATRGTYDPGECGSGPTVWLHFTPPADMRVQVDTFGSSGDPDLSIGVFRGARDALQTIACAQAPFGAPFVRFDAQGGVPLHVAVHSTQNPELVVHIVEAPPPLAITNVLVDPTATFGPTTFGAAVLTGHVAVSAPFSSGEICLSIEQGGASSGSCAFLDSALADAEGRVPWSMLVAPPGEGAAWSAGPAAASGEANVREFLEGQTATAPVAADLALVPES